MVSNVIQEWSINSDILFSLIYILCLWLFLSMPPLLSELQIILPSLNPQQTRPVLWKRMSGLTCWFSKTLNSFIPVEMRSLLAWRRAICLFREREFSILSPHSWVFPPISSIPLKIPGNLQGYLPSDTFQILPWSETTFLPYWLTFRCNSATYVSPTLFGYVYPSVPS